MSCDVPNIDVIALGTRIAIYTYAGCSALLGFLTLVGTGPRREIENEEDEAAYVDKVVQHIKDVDQSVMTSTLMGIALIVAAVLHEHLLGTFTQYHAYVVLMLLWVITLTGMWFVIHAWVFDILRKNKRRMATFSFWFHILTQSRWFILQFSLMGAYGIYITLKRDTLPLPSCAPQFFQSKPFTLLVYGLSTFPVLNACMLFILTGTFVWILSVFVAICSRKGWKGQVDPRVFCVFWLVEYICVISALVITIELQLKKNSHGGSVGWPFGSTLALALTFIPLRLVVVRVWQLTVGEEGVRPMSMLGNRASRARTNARTDSEEGLNQGNVTTNSASTGQPAMNNARGSWAHFGPPPYRDTWTHRSDN